jgi:hypothetical protein
VFWTFVMDDDDPYVANGTPHYDHFCAAATNHGFECPDIVPVFIGHEPLHHTDDGSSGIDVTAEVFAFSGALDPATVLFSYRVDGGAFTELPMTSIGADEYTVTIPPIGSGEVEYYLTATTMDDSTGTSPPDAPATLHAFDVAYVYDDLEGAVPGWTVGAAGDDATTGLWELVDPIGTLAQPEHDATPDPGVLAFVTGQCAGPNCQPECDLGCNDVDGGVTTLLSPVYDVAGASSVKVKYERWYSNNTGASANIDRWVVDVSNDGGASWTNVEDTNVSAATWRTVTVDVDALFGTADRVQVRFRASDELPGSLVEAGVDEFRLLADFGPPTDADVALGAGALDFVLSQNQPNPFRPQTEISYAIPEPARVELTVYNVRGQVVRQLASGPREVGRYTVSWNGEDSGGRRVAAGVYFYRLKAGGKTLTKKMTVLK